MIQGIAHVALYTNKFDETVQFYLEAFDGIELGYFQTSRRGCWLQIGTSILEVFEDSKEQVEGGFKHIALQCDSVDESYQKALAAKATAHIEPKDICLDLDIKQHLRIAFVKGINGEQIELCETIQ